MANLRRHFNFATNKSSIDNSVNETDNLLQFDKHNLMNNICSCLDMCCSYIQTLNALCSTGSLLARNLLQTVQNVPAYQNIAQQFLFVWDEVGKATAGASAAVKTETLMVLQEVLNTLEVGNPENSSDNSLPDVFQVIGSCLHSFIELQAQFSMSTSKSLSKLSKNFSNDAFLHTLNWKSHERNTLKGTKNSELCSTIKKHYSHLLHKYESQKSAESTDASQSQFFVSPSVMTHDTLHFSQSASQTECSKSDHPNLWTSHSLWSNNPEIKDVPLSLDTAHKTQRALPQVELNEVINLLSCVPLDNFPTPSTNQLSPHHPMFEPLPSYNFWPQGAGPVIPRHQRPWSEGSRDITFGYDSWIWRADNLNCSDLPSRSDDNVRKRSIWQADFPSKWSAGSGSSDDTSSNIDVQSCQNLFTSQRLRRYSSSDGLSDALENVLNAEDRLWNVQNHKTSTWPLKQASSRFLTGLEWSDEIPQSKYMPT